MDVISTVKHVLSDSIVTGEIVCRNCYDKNYSCKVYTLSGADMLKLLDTSTIKANEEDKEKCPR